MDDTIGLMLVEKCCTEENDFVISWIDCGSQVVQRYNRHHEFREHVPIIICL